MNNIKDIIITENEAVFFFEYLDWDTHFFNKPAYILNIEKSNLLIDTKIKIAIQDKLDNSFVTIKLNTSIDDEILNFFQDCGFKYIDTEIVLESVNNIVSHKHQPRVSITKLDKNINLPYIELGQNFSLTRFHSDLNIKNAKADELWINYIKSYQLSEHRHLFIARVENEVAGVILVNTDNTTATLFFVAVIEKFVGIGIGTLLIKESISHFKNYKIKTETQIKNIKALNFYIKNGLSKVNSTYTVLHRWS